MEKWMDLSGKVMIVTGGSQGIGEHAVKTLRNNGAAVVVADLRNNETFEKDENIFFVECNVADKKSVDSMMEQVIKKYGTMQESAVRDCWLIFTENGRNMNFQKKTLILWSMSIKKEYFCAHRLLHVT